MQILQVIFGQELPDEATSFAQQSFAVGVAAIGLAAFALVLALVEQVRHRWVMQGKTHREVGSRLTLMCSAACTLKNSQGI